MLHAHDFYAAIQIPRKKGKREQEEISSRWNVVIKSFCCFYTSCLPKDCCCTSGHTPARTFSAWPRRGLNSGGVPLSTCRPAGRTPSDDLQLRYYTRKHTNNIHPTFLYVSSRYHSYAPPLPFLVLKKQQQHTHAKGKQMWIRTVFFAAAHNLRKKIHLQSGAHKLTFCAITRNRESGTAAAAAAEANPGTQWYMCCNSQEECCARTCVVCTYILSIACAAIFLFLSAYLSLFLCACICILKICSAGCAAAFHKPLLLWYPRLIILAGKIWFAPGGPPLHPPLQLSHSGTSSC